MVNRWKRGFTERWSGWLSLFLTLFITISLALYFGFRADRKKSLSVREIGRRSLLNLDASQSSNLNVLFGTGVVKEPWIVTARLSNSGNLPIEERDVYKPLTMVFSGSHLLHGEITSRYPKDVITSITILSDTVIVYHGLLNPGDWIETDLLFDGEPDIPIVSYRASAVTEIPIYLPVEKLTSTRLIQWLPAYILYILLIITTVGIGVAFIVVVLDIIRKIRHGINETRLRDPASLTKFVVNQVKKGMPSRVAREWLVRRLLYMLPEVQDDFLANEIGGIDFEDAAASDNLYRLLSPLLIRIKSRNLLQILVTDLPIPFLLAISCISGLIITTGIWIEIL